jgi:uncharacterized protein DUF3619
MNERDFAERIASHLDHGLNGLRPGTLYRLRLVREAALARVDHEKSVPGAVGGILSASGPDRVLNRRVLIPLSALILGLSVLLFWQDQQAPRQSDYAELDAQVLTDELPVTAYLDTGFEVWLYHHTSAD